MSVLFYSRPNYIDRSSGPLNKAECQRFAEKTKGRKDTLPPELSFDNVVSGKTLPPCTLRDFMDYLVYVAHDAENLQFYLWLEDYKKRFDALSEREKALSPEWNPAESTDHEEAPTPFGRQRSKSNLRFTAKAIEVDSTADARSINLDDLTTLPSRPVSGSGVSPAAGSAEFDAFVARSLAKSKMDEISEGPDVQARLKWEPFSCQPFRAEVARIVANYVAPGAARELNLSYRDRSAVLHALQHTTHPSAFSVVSTMVEATLRGQLHPNFVRWSVCNGNKPRVYFVRTMGIAHIVMGLIIAVLLTMSSASRWLRILNAPVTFIGMSTMIAAYKGLCVILHRSHERALKPWESDVIMARSSDTKSSSATSLHDEESTIGSLKGANRQPKALNTFGESNNFDGEPWMDAYKKKPLLRKVFDASTWVQEEGVRVVQDKIVRQSQAWALIYTTLLTVVFVALPKGNLY